MAMHGLRPGVHCSQVSVVAGRVCDFVQSILAPSIVCVVCENSGKSAVLPGLLQPSLLLLASLTGACVCLQLAGITSTLRTAVPGPAGVLPQGT